MTDYSDSMLKLKVLDPIDDGYIEETFLIKTIEVDRINEKILVKCFTSSRDFEIPFCDVLYLNELVILKRKKEK